MGGGSLLSLVLLAREWLAIFGIPIVVITFSATLWGINQWNIRKTWTGNLSRRPDDYIEAKLRSWLTRYGFGFPPGNPSPVSEKTRFQFVATNINGPRLTVTRLSSHPDLLLMATRMAFNSEQQEKLAKLDEKIRQWLSQDIGLAMAQMGLSYDAREFPKQAVVQGKFPLDIPMNALQVSMWANHVARGATILNILIARALAQQQEIDTGANQILSQGRR